MSDRATKVLYATASCMRCWGTQTGMLQQRTLCPPAHAFFTWLLGHTVGFAGATHVGLNDSSVGASGTGGGMEVVVMEWVRKAVAAPPPCGGEISWGNQLKLPLNIATRLGLVYLATEGCILGADLK